jgi:N-acetylmuramoyl-L-alanine amidase
MRGAVVNKRFRAGFFSALIIILTLPAFPSTERIGIVRIQNEEYLPLDEIVTRTGFEHSFDMISRKGRLYRKNHYAVYGIGLSVLLVDGRLYKTSFAVRRKAGRVLIPADVAEYIVKSFRPDIRLNRDREGLYAEFRRDEKPSTEGEERTPLPAGKDRISFIVIDPGHGGKDPGAVGKGGLKEKEITLKVAKYLEMRIRKIFPELRITVTRADDRFIELSRRTEIANRLLKKNENGIFLSIHVNSSLSSRISGHETFFLSQNPTNEDARNTAALENNVIILEEKSKGRKTRDDIDYIEATMITTQIQKESSALAGSIQKGLAEKNKVSAARGVKKADFFVLRGVLMPAALVEIGYISNRNEAGHLKKEEHRKAVADGIAEGVELFIKKYNQLIKVN